MINDEQINFIIYIIFIKICMYMCMNVYCTSTSIRVYIHVIYSRKMINDELISIISVDR